jgi:hypothetical protein
MAREEDEIGVERINKKGMMGENKRIRKGEDRLGRTR